MSFKNSVGEAHPQSSTSSSAQRRKPSKRPFVHSDDDDDDDDDVPVPTAQRMKRARTADTDASLSVVTTPDPDDDMDIDVEAFRGSAQRSLSAADDSRFLLDDDQTHDSLHKARADASKKRKKSSVVSKKSHAVYSDEEESHVEHDSVEDDPSDSAPPLAEPSDDDFDLDTPPKRGAPRTKAGPTKGKAGKVKAAQLKGAKAKGPKDKEKEKDREIFMRDERRLAVPPATTSRASSTATQNQPAELFSSDEHAPSSAVDPLPEESQPVKDPLSQSIPKKRKLPPIKKTKMTTGTTGTSTPTTTTQKPAPAPAPVQELAKPLLPTSEQRKQALTGVRDIDLGDSKIYAELFKGAGGNTPKSGLKNAEERRKELDKMRDEARARRNEGAKYTFDLQRQADKIAHFEQRLRAENSTVLHPNFLAAKFRDEWELDRRNRRGTPKEEGEA